METTTHPAVELTDSLSVEGSVVLAHRVRHKLMSVAVLTRAELQAFVQQAHDVYGIAADPFATPCEGSGNCRAALHEHGCFADTDGTACDDPEDHPAPHAAQCGDPCRHDAECPHGKAWTEGETCPACTPAERPNPWLAGLMAGPVNPL